MCDVSLWKFKLDINFIDYNLKEDFNEGALVLLLLYVAGW